MVRTRFCLLVLAAALLLSAASASVAEAQTRVYHFNYEYAKVWINQDATIDLFYNVSLTLDSGAQIRSVLMGQPTGDFHIDEAFDQYGRQLQTYDYTSGTNYRVNVTLYEPLTAGNTVWFTLLTNVGGMIKPDTMNPGNLGMQFAPAWRDEVPISDVRIQIVLPPNVTVAEVLTTERFWNSTSTEPDGSLALYWETPVIQPGEQFTVGVSFPAKYLPQYEAQPAENLFLRNLAIILGVAGFGVAILVVAVMASRKRPYQTPKVSMETLGIRRGLTAVEASYLLQLKPTQIVTEILYSLLQKRAVWVESAKPTLLLRIMPEFKDKKGTDEAPLRYYEIDFLEAIKSDGTLDEEELAHAIMFLRDTLEQKLRGYSRSDTVDYYKKIVEKAWTQVEQAGTADIASKAYDEQLLWLLLDPNYRARTETTFQNRVFEPSPLWFWWWYGYTHYTPRPTYTPNVNAPTQSAKPPGIPGAEFARNLVTSVEKTSSNIVGNLEKFAGAIIPAAPPAKASHESARQGASCACACAACACACACVSCACACAGGGVG